MHSKVSLRIHYSWQKKCRTTKKQMDGPTPVKTEQACNALYPAAFGIDDN
jgi:hypothetical protein